MDKAPKQFSDVIKLDTSEPQPHSWEDIGAKCALITKAAYYTGLEKNKRIVSDAEILAWLKKNQYYVNEKDMVRKMLLILSSAGVVTRHGYAPQIERWEWHLK